MVRAARRIAVIAAGMAVAVPLASAGATPPTVEVIPYDSTEVIAPGEPLGFGVNACPFTVTLHHEGTFVYRTLFDRDGTPIRQLIRSAQFTETYPANDRSLTTISVAPAHLRAAECELTITATGNQRHVIPRVWARASPSRPLRCRPQDRCPHRRVRPRHPRRQRVLGGTVRLMPSNHGARVFDAVPSHPNATLTRHRSQRSHWLACKEQGADAGASSRRAGVWFSARLGVLSRRCTEARVNATRACRGTASVRRGRRLRPPYTPDCL